MQGGLSPSTWNRSEGIMFDETAVLSSLCGKTLAGLHAMYGKRDCVSIKHLILQAIELKEDGSNETATNPRKPRIKRTKQPG
jgi:hypothetical protein